MRRQLPHLLRLTAFAVLVAFLVQPMLFEPLLKPLVQANAPAIYNQGSLLSLTLSHLATVFIATLAATIVAVGLAILVTRPIGAEFLPLSRSLVNIGQTFPPVAVLALAVPAVGFGEKPTLIALFLYGELPLALPVILAGIRLSVVISLATATIGSTVAAKTLGEVILAGLQSNNLAFVLEGGLVVAVLAVLIYDAFSAIERVLSRRAGRA